MKTCPFCAEEIQDAAIVCKHCGRELTTPRSVPAAASTVTPVTPASSSRNIPHIVWWIGGSILAFLFFGPALMSIAVSVLQILFYFIRDVFRLIFA